MSKHTEGPWHISESEHEGAGLLIKPIPGQVVCECDPVPEMVANARLIAAAPEMLEALEMVDQVFHLLSAKEIIELIGRRNVRAVRSAVAKAKVGEP